METGKRRTIQQSLWVETKALAEPPGYPFYQRLGKLLGKLKFDLSELVADKGYHSNAMLRAEDASFKSSSSSASLRWCPRDVL